MINGLSFTSHGSVTPSAPTSIGQQAPRSRRTIHGIGRLLCIAATALLTGIPAHSQSPAQQTNVLIAGAGTPRDLLPLILESLSDYLKQEGVKTKLLSGDPKTKDECMQELKASGVPNLLYVALRSEQPGVKVDLGGYLKVQSYDGAGQLLWEENISRRTSRSAEDMAKKMKERKLKKRVGGPGLPK